MLNVNILIKRLKRNLNDAVFNSVDTDFYIEILYEETLPLIADYYPNIVKGIKVTEKMGIRTINPYTDMESKLVKYAIPMENDLYPFIGIEQFMWPYNNVSGTYGSPTIETVSISKVIAPIGTGTIRTTCDFEPPNILVLDPPPTNFVEFTVHMKQLPRLESIRKTYHEWVKELFEYDVKIALYNKFYTASDGGVFGGVEIKDYISHFESAKEDRKELIEQFESDWYKDPDRFDGFFNDNGGYA